MTFFVIFKKKWGINMSKSRRLLELMEYVQTKRKFTVQELADEFHVSYRTMWRYLQELSELGVPLYSEPGVQGGYSILKKNGQPTLQTGKRKIFNRILDYRELWLAGYHFTSSYQVFSEAEVLIPRLWFKLFNRLDKIPVKSNVRIGVANNRKNNFSYWVMVEVKDFDHLPDDLTTLIIPKGSYASFSHYGSMDRENISTTYQYIETWLKENNCKQKDLSQIIEIYDHKYQPTKPSNQFEILIPMDKDILSDYPK